MCAKTTKYLLYNEKLLPHDEPMIHSTNRSFRYGDGLFETIRLFNGELHLYEDHMTRLFEGLEFLKIQTPDQWNAEFFRAKINKLIEKNGIDKNARIRLSIFRGDGGFYTPRTNRGDFLLEVVEANIEGFPLNKKGLKIDIFSDMEKSSNLFSNFKTNSALVYVLASVYRKAENLDDCLIINSKHRVAEAISSNVFIVKDGEIFTPPLSEGCVAGVMRTHILKIMEVNQIKYQESPILLEDLFQADEIFLTDTMKGIRWVGSYKVKRYELGVAGELSKYLNKRS